MLVILLLLYITVMTLDQLTISKYSRTRMKEKQIKETFGYKKRFHSAFMRDFNFQC